MFNLKWKSIFNNEISEFSEQSNHSRNGLIWFMLKWNLLWL